MGLCDAARLKAAIEQRQEQVTDHLEPSDIFRTRLLVNKVLLARCVEDKSSQGDERPVQAADYEGFTSVYRIMGGHVGKQRRWFVFEPKSVQPEYLVELEYSTLSSKREREPSAAQMKDLAKGLNTLMVPSEAEAVDVNPLTRELMRFVQQCALAPVSDPYDQVCTSVLNLPPTLPQREKHSTISDAVLQEQSAGRELSQLEQLNLHGNAIRKIEGLGQLINLRILILCFNDIHKIEGIEHVCDPGRVLFSHAVQLAGGRGAVHFSASTCDAFEADEPGFGSWPHEPALRT